MIILKFFYDHNSILKNTFLHSKTNTATYCQNSTDANKICRIVKTKVVQKLTNIITFRCLSKHVKNWNEYPCQQR